MSVCLQTILQYSFAAPCQDLCSFYTWKQTDVCMCDSSVLPPGVCVENVGTTTRLRYGIPALCCCPGLHPFSNDIQLMCSSHLLFCGNIVEIRNSEPHRRPPHASRVLACDTCMSGKAVPCFKAHWWTSPSNMLLHWFFIIPIPRTISLRRSTQMYTANLCFLLKHSH